MIRNKESFKKAYGMKFAETQGKSLEEGSSWDKYQALVSLINSHLAPKWVESNRRYYEKREKQVYYFSMEFLIGKLLPHYLSNLGIKDIVREGLVDMGIDLDDLIDAERDAGLGNGGLGRLAACFLDSMASMGIPGHGNGIRYKYGLFKQKIVNGFQAEVPDSWLDNGYPWEIRKPEKAVVVKFKGNVRADNPDGSLTFYHENYEPVLAVPYDIPIVGYRNGGSINNLRLWSAEPMADEFDIASFNRGEYRQAVGYMSEIEAISYILYPDDSTHAGRELRLKQEYFFVAAGLGSIVRSFKEKMGSLKDFSKKVAIHINDTHPALCIPELMRILIDEEGMGWDDAFNTAVETISYTNHTIMPEALEKWPVDIFKYLLPRIYMIVEEIDKRYRIEMARRYPDSMNMIHDTAIIRDDEVWMANLAVIGSHSVNGVSRLHSHILKTHLLRDFHKIYPRRINNKTNGISHRRFLLEANPSLSKLITEAIGEDWFFDPRKLERLIEFREDRVFIDKLAESKYENKAALANIIQDRMGISIDPNSIFDIQVKRIHAYKRQLLNIFRIMDIYNQLKVMPNLPYRPHTFIFAGKAAPGYHYAKTIIKLINALANKINNDPDTGDIIKVVFLENFNVTLAERIYPAADISQQISTASREASGTGNMKFMMNGALTLGTHDGANVEIREAVGDDNIFMFGLKANEVMDFYGRRSYDPWQEYHSCYKLKKVIDQLINGFFSEDEGDFRDIYHSLLGGNDEFFVLKDFCSYMEAWYGLNMLYGDPAEWNAIALANIAKSGVFSSDRTIKEYAGDIWHVPVGTVD
ncbi:MAG TPA: glycogen/starch/alpha-glucan phosphorylase [Clostridia bacterium]|nr:glycogen/starch/alpha-glucan phosphorylase [Clostridia bacterium]